MPALRRHPALEQLKDAPIVAEHRSPLWRDGRNDEFALVAGKVHNLRIARSAFDGVVIPAGSTFSFWRQLGRPSKRRGYVEGREIQAGCVVPTIAGGLCQLSNALATCAVDGHITLTERHGHTALVERRDGASQIDVVDATVLWNYVDLRFVPDFDVRIEVEMTSDELVVRMRAADRIQRGAMPPVVLLASADIEAAVRPVARGCLTCAEVSCFRHGARTAIGGKGATAVLVNAWTPEFARYIDGLGRDTDWFLPWTRPARRRGGAWAPGATARRTVAVIASLRRTLLLRRRGIEGGERQAAVMRGDRWIADRFSQALQPQHTHLVIDQSLLVPLAQRGALHGRTYEVFAHALPADELQHRLDVAGRCWPKAASLRDFRIGEEYCATELDALNRAQRVVTPHADVARHLRAQLGAKHVETVDWILPARLPLRRVTRPGMPPVVAFPASALARKGANEMAEAIRRLGWRLVVLGTPPSDVLEWRDIEVSYMSYRDQSWLCEADVVALPAHVEHTPRGLLTAISHDVPVVATPACGLPSSLKLIEIPAGDVSALVTALQDALRIRTGR